MTDRGAALAAAALDLVGCPFRLHGREPLTGLDCVGVVSASLAAISETAVIPNGYGLRNVTAAKWMPLAQRSGLVTRTGPVRAGDVMLIALRRAQHHLVIAIDRTSVVHAHAGLRRVVRQPIDPAWDVCARWFIPSRTEG